MIFKHALNFFDLYLTFLIFGHVFILLREEQSGLQNNSEEMIRVCAKFLTQNSMIFPRLFSNVPRLSSQRFLLFFPGIYRLKLRYFLNLLNFDIFSTIFYSQNKVP